MPLLLVARLGATFVASLLLKILLAYDVSLKAKVRLKDLPWALNKNCSLELSHAAVSQPPLTSLMEDSVQLRW